MFRSLVPLGLVVTAVLVSCGDSQSAAVPPSPSEAAAPSATPDYQRNVGLAAAALQEAFAQLTPCNGLPDTAADCNKAISTVTAKTDALAHTVDMLDPSGSQPATGTAHTIVSLTRQGLAHMTVAAQTSNSDEALAGANLLLAARKAMDTLADLLKRST